MNIMHTFGVASQFMYRAFYIRRKRLSFFILNYVCIYPITYIFCFAYLTPQAYELDAQAISSSVISLLSGNIVLLLLNINFNIFSPLIYDRIHTRYIDYQIRHIHPYALLAQQAIFAACFSFTMLTPFFPLSAYILGTTLNTSQTSWPLLYMVMLCGSLCCTTYTTLAVWVLTKPDQIKNFWIRFSIPLFNLGGFWAPWHTTYKTSRILGYAMLLNPFTYITEGLRYALTASSSYISAGYCMGILMLFSSLFFIGSCYFLKKRMDPVY